MGGRAAPRRRVRFELRDQAMKGEKKHTMKILDDEISALGQSKPGAGSIMTSMVRVLDVHNYEATISGVKEAIESKKDLSLEEIFDNLFVINFMSHSTTANTLVFAMLFLAANTEVKA